MKLIVDLVAENGKIYKLTRDTVTDEVTIEPPASWRTPKIPLANLQRALYELTEVDSGDHARQLGA